MIIIAIINNNNNNNNQLVTNVDSMTILKISKNVLGVVCFISFHLYWITERFKTFYFSITRTKLYLYFSLNGYLPLNFCSGRNTLWKSITMKNHQI